MPKFTRLSDTLLRISANRGCEVSKPFKLVCVPALVGPVATLGCGESNGDGGSGGSAGTGGVGGSVPTVTVEVTVIEFQPGQANIAAEGAEVCVLDSSNCASTDAEGLVTLEAPENAETGFTGLRGGQLFALGMGEELARWDFGPAGRD